MKAFALKNEIWVWLPRERDGALHPGVGELLYEASALARRLEVPLVAGSDRRPAEAEQTLLGGWGVKRLWCLDRQLAPHPLAPGGQSPFELVLAGSFPRAFLFLADAQAKVLAPPVAARGGAEFISAASGISSDGSHFVVARSTLGGQVESLLRLDFSRPLVLTLVPGQVGAVTAPGVFSSPRPTESSPVLQAVEAPAQPNATELTKLLSPDPANLDLPDAERVVAFGRGAFSPESISLVNQLASRLGAVVAGTRPAADEGWLPFSRQVGLTGAVISPRLYVAVGISGAPYHLVGLKEVDTLIAINNDPEAPIFNRADLGIVGDLKQVLPALLEILASTVAGSEPLEATLLKGL